MSRRGAIGMVEQRVIDRRWTREHGDALAFDELEHLAGVEHRHREDGGTAHEARQAPGLVTEDVEERIRDQVAVAGTQIGPVAPVEVRAQRLAVRHHDTLGRPRGARREHHVARIIGTDRRDPRVEIHDGHVLRARDELVPADRDVVGFAREQDRVLERGQLRARVREQRRVVRVEEPTHREQHTRPASLEHERGFGATEPGVDRDERAAGGGHTERGNDPLQRVRCPHGHAVTALDARSHERTSRAVDHRAQRGEVDPPGPVHHGFRRAGANRTVAHHRGDRRPGDLGAHHQRGTSPARLMRCIVRVCPW